MEKYGVLHEMECSCGCKVVINEHQQPIETIKEASKGLFGIEHNHTFKEVTDGDTKGGHVLAGQSSGEGSV